MEIREQVTNYVGKRIQAMRQGAEGIPSHHNVSVTGLVPLGVDPGGSVVRWLHFAEQKALPRYEVSCIVIGKNILYKDVKSLEGLNGI